MIKNGKRGKQEKHSQRGITDQPDNRLPENDPLNGLTTKGEGVGEEVGGVPWRSGGGNTCLNVHCCGTFIGKWKFVADRKWLIYLAVRDFLFLWLFFQNFRIAVLIIFESSITVILFIDGRDFPLSGDGGHF